MAESFDGTFDFRGGVNQAARPDQIGNNQVSGAVNCTFVNGLRPRPPLYERKILVTSTDGITGPTGIFRSYQQIFDEGKLQAVAPYFSEDGTFALAIVSGVIYRIDVDSFKADVLLSNTVKLDEYRTRYNWSQAGRFFVIYDDPGYPIIIEGADIRRANPNATYSNGTPAPEIPVTALGVYNQFRLAVGTRYNEFVIGDPAAVGFPNGPITFTEVLNPSAPRKDQFFSVGNRPYNEAITFMGNLQVVDTSTGIGPLIVSTASQFWAYRTDTTAQGWEFLQNFGTLIAVNDGIAGQRAAVNVGFDLLYISTMGKVYSLNTGRQEQGTWKHTSISEEVKEYIKTSNPELLQFAVATFYNNRAYFTVNPYRVPVKDSRGRNTFDVAFDGVIVLETAIQSGLAGSPAPVWAGLWTGIKFQESVQIGTRQFFWAKNGNSNAFYELMEGRSFDFQGSCFRRIKSRVYTKALGAANFLDDKEGVNVQAYLSSVDIKNTFQANPYFRAYQQNFFSKLTTIKYEVDDDAICTQNRLPSGIKELNMGGFSGAKACDAATQKSYAVWKRGIVMLEFIGNYILDAIVLRYKMLQSSGTPELICELNAKAVNTRDCDFVSDWKFYSTYGTVLASKDTQCRSLLPK